MGKEVVEYLSGIDRDDRKRIGQAIRRYQDFREGDVKRLTDAKPYLRLRVGDHRVLFRVDESVMSIPFIGKRDDVYRRFKDLGG